MRRVFVAIVLLLIAIQFIPHRQKSQYGDLKDDFIMREHPPKALAQTIRLSCYECHASGHHNTTWYTRIAPFSWYAYSTKKRALESLDFSRWGGMDLWQRRLFLQGAIIYDIKRSRMPPRSYLWLHPDAAIDAKRFDQLERWIKKILQKQN